MNHGFRIHFALSEFATAAALITFAACGVSYFYVKNTNEQVQEIERQACRTPKEPVVVNHYITVPAPIVRVRVIVPKQDPPVLRMPLDGGFPAQPQVWDNDNLPSASTPLVLKASKE